MLVKVGDPQALADAIEMVASNPELQKTLSAIANKHAVSTFDIQVMLEAYEHAYKHLSAAEDITCPAEQ